MANNNEQLNLDQSLLASYLIGAIADQNVAAYIIDLCNNNVIQIKGTDLANSEEITLQQQLDHLSVTYSSFGDYHSVKKFNLLKSLPDRLKDKRVITNLFKGFDDSWCISKFVRLGKDEPVRFVLHTVEKVDDEFLSFESQKKQIRENNKLHKLINAFMNEYDSIINLNLSNSKVEILRLADRLKPLYHSVENVPLFEELIRIYLKVGVFKNDIEKVSRILTVDYISKNIPIGNCESFVYRNERDEFGELKISRSSKKFALLGFSSKNLEIRETYDKVYLDSLTGIRNRKYYDDRLSFKQSKAVIMIDVDNFKNINDTYGHQFGDVVLTKIAEVLNKNIRKTDRLVRYGGDEFLLSFDDISEDDVLKVLCKIKNSVSTLKIEEHPEVNLSISLGLAYGDGIVSDMFVVADEALYESKKTKNTITSLPYSKQSNDTHIKRLV